MIVLNIAIVILTFLGMEFTAWFMHKYVMHGIGWYFHRDHHKKEPGIFEKNDVFFLIFAIPSWLFMMFGMMHGNDWKLYVGIGIAIYGACYFLVHDVFIHQRLPWFKRSDNIYFRAIRKAHKVHHKNTDKEEGKCFGMLLVPFKYFREAGRSVRRTQNA
ncbi:MAG TPA: sterol desaturase family protein [Cryomorphaceae bacterium]|nr:sterol desaturase family protein [Cryomorphaceae bacterium]